MATQFFLRKFSERIRNRSLPIQRRRCVAHRVTPETPADRIHGTIGCFSCGSRAGAALPFLVGKGEWKIELDLPLFVQMGNGNRNQRDDGLSRVIGKRDAGGAPLRRLGPDSWRKAAQQHAGRYNAPPPRGTKRGADNLPFEDTS